MRKQNKTQKVKCEDLVGVKNNLVSDFIGNEKL